MNITNSDFNAVRADKDVSRDPDALVEALVERELQTQDAWQRQFLLWQHNHDIAQRRRQTAVVATLVNIASAAALLAIALVWQFYFPVAAALANSQP